VAPCRSDGVSRSRDGRAGLVCTTTAGCSKQIRCEPGGALRIHREQQSPSPCISQVAHVTFAEADDVIASADSRGGLGG